MTIVQRNRRRFGRILLCSIFSFLFGCAYCTLSAQNVASPSATNATPGAQVIAHEQHLIPEPREITFRRSFALTHGVEVIASNSDPEDRFAAENLREALEALDIHAGSGQHGAVVIELLRTTAPRANSLLAEAKVRFDEPMRDEGYVILPRPEGIAIVGATAEGVFYGVQTAKQLVRGRGLSAEMASALIRDWPAMRYRGMDDDLSRGPVPTLEFQKQQIRTFAAYKLNAYSPYFENTLQYKSNPLGASPGGAMTGAELRELAEYAAKYHITIIPEQEAFGHLHNLLSYERYANLAETPHGTVLAPGQPEVLPMVRQWFTEIASESPGPFVHIGADETFDLGRGQTHPAVQQRGLGPVYLDFINQIYQVLQPLHKRILFWGDIALNEPQLVATLPKDLIAVPWTYDPEPKGYDSFILPFVKAGMETWVAPGVSNWNRVYPDNSKALPNIQGFIRDGQRLGSKGALNTAWNDDGEGLFAEDWYGVLFGAAASWQPGESSIPSYERSYGSVFHGDSTGKIDEAQQELMTAHTLLDAVDESGVSDRLFWLDPWSAEGQAEAKQLRPVLHDLRLHAEQALVLLAEAQSEEKLREPGALQAMELGARRMDLIGLKFQLSDEIITAYQHAYAAQSDPKQADAVDTYLYEISDTNGRCQDIRNGYSLTRDLFEAAWLRENRPFWLHNVLGRYDLAIELWIGRGNMFTGALEQWHRVHSLPKPEELGLPGGGS